MATVTSSKTQKMSTKKQQPKESAQVEPKSKPKNKPEKDNKKTTAEEKTKTLKTQGLAMLFNGGIPKGHSFMFWVSDPKTIVQYVKDNFVRFYGPEVSGKYVDCDDGNKAFEKCIQDAKTAAHPVKGDVIAANIANVAALLRQVDGGKAVLHNFTLCEPAEGKETKKKPAAKKTTPETTGVKTDSKKAVPKKSDSKSKPPETDDDADGEKSAESANESDNDECNVVEKASSDDELNENSESDNDGPRNRGKKMTAKHK